jgi:hypothetical protein
MDGWREGRGVVRLPEWPEWAHAGRWEEVEFWLPSDGMWEAKIQVGARVFWVCTPRNTKHCSPGGDSCGIMQSGVPGQISVN